ncbi:class II fructose-bisphosphate aldolase [Candidatus Woesearchaeota archaeon]|nr:MAG: class II fructose-bisphosphate aldolase [Candidatus Woesearchaeota archaeon]
MYKTIKAYFNDAQRRGYALGAFNFSTLEIVQAIVRMGVAKKAPFIIETSEGESKHLGLEMAVAIFKTLKKQTKAKFFLHLDHGKSFEYVKKAIQAGYPSVHIDTSALPFKDNLKTAKKVVNYAHKRNVWVEAELGHVGGSSTLHEKEGYSKVLKTISFTDPEMAKEFSEKTGLDSLAVTIGNVHGLWKGIPHINFELLKKIHKMVKKPLVLHGGSGIPKDQIRKALSLGISKVNINTEMRVAFSSSIRKSLKDPKMFVPTKYLPKATEAVQKIVESKMILFKSVNKA